MRRKKREIPYMSCVALILYYCHILCLFESPITTWEKEVEVPPSIEDHFEPIILSKSVMKIHKYLCNWLINIMKCIWWLWRFCVAVKLTILIQPNSDNMWHWIMDHFIPTFIQFSSSNIIKIAPHIHTSKKTILLP